MKKNRIISAVSALAMLGTAVGTVPFTANAYYKYSDYTDHEYFEKYGSWFCYHLIPNDLTQEQVKERLNDEFYAYKYVFHVDESGFFLKEFANRVTNSPMAVPSEKDRVFFLPKEVYENSKPDDMEDFKVGDVVMYDGETLTENFNYPKTIQPVYKNQKIKLMNLGAYSDLTGEDLQPQIDNAYDTFLSTMDSIKAPDPVTSYDELVALRFPDNPQYQYDHTDVKFGGNRLNSYQNDHIYYVEKCVSEEWYEEFPDGYYVLRQLDRKYNINDYYIADNEIHLKDDAPSALVLNSAVGLDIPSINLIPEDSRDSFEIGDIIYLNYAGIKPSGYHYGVAFCNSCSSVKKLCSLTDIIENSTDIQLSSTVIKSDETNLGDANCDGNVNIADAVLVQQFIVNPDKYTLSEQSKLNADVFNTGDGVTMADALEIQLMIANN